MATFTIMKGGYYVYVLQSELHQTTFNGYTADLQQRLSEHNSGKTKSIKHKLPMKLVYWEAYQAMTLAKKRGIKLN